MGIDTLIISNKTKEKRCNKSNHPTLLTYFLLFSSFSFSSVYISSARYTALQWIRQTNIQVLYAWITPSFHPSTLPSTLCQTCINSIHPQHGSLDQCVLFPYRRDTSPSSIHPSKPYKITSLHISYTNPSTYSFLSLFLPQVNSAQWYPWKAKVWFLLSRIVPTYLRVSLIHNVITISLQVPNLLRHTSLGNRRDISYEFELEVEDRAVRVMDFQIWISRYVRRECCHMIVQVWMTTSPHLTTKGYLNFYFIRATLECPTSSSTYLSI